MGDFHITGKHNEGTPQVIIAMAHNLKYGNGACFCDDCWDRYYDHKAQVYAAMLNAYARQERIVYDRDDRPLSPKEEKKLWAQIKKQYLKQQ